MNKNNQILSVRQIFCYTMKVRSKVTLSELSSIKFALVY